jgi:catechol 2,3-dioxygenase-like lactoylglutathione lyase family enzyme
VAQDSDDWTLARLFHININVTNLDRSVDFYRRLGYEVRNYITQDSFRDESSAGEGASLERKYRGCQLLSPTGHGDALLDLIEWIEPASPPAAPLERNSLGVARIAIWIRNLPALYQNLLAEGVEFETPMRGYMGQGIESITFVRDPDGLLVELIDFPPGLPAAARAAGRPASGGAGLRQ